MVQIAGNSRRGNKPSEIFYECKIKPRKKLVQTSRRKQNYLYKVREYKEPVQRKQFPWYRKHDLVRTVWFLLWCKRDDITDRRSWKSLTLFDTWWLLIYPKSFSILFQFCVTLNQLTSLIITKLIWNNIPALYTALHQNE